MLIWRLPCGRSSAQGKECAFIARFRIVLANIGKRIVDLFAFLICGGIQKHYYEREVRFIVLIISYLFYAYQSIITRILAHILLVQTRYYNGFQLYLSKPQVGRNPADPILRGVSHVRICRFHDSFWHRFGPSCTHGHLYGDFDTNFSLEGRLAGRSHRSDRSISGVGHFQAVNSAFPGARVSHIRELPH